MNLLYIIILLFVFYKMSNVVDTFLVVASNNDSIPENSIKTIDDIQNETLNKGFSLSKPIDIDSTFTLYNNNIAFALNNLFKFLALEYFNINVPKFSKDKCYISNDMNNIYYKDNYDGDGSVLYICNFNLTNPKNLFTKNIRIGVLVKNEKGKILFMKLDNALVSNDNSVKSIDKLQPTYYTLKNNMFLMDPWSTNNNIISNDQIKKFNSILQQKNKQLLNLKPVDGLITNNYQKIN